MRGGWPQRSRRTPCPARSSPSRRMPIEEGLGVPRIESDGLVEGGDGLVVLLLLVEIRPAQHVEVVPTGPDHRPRGRGKSPPSVAASPPPNGPSGGPPAATPGDIVARPSAIIIAARRKRPPARPTAASPSVRRMGSSSFGLPTVVMAGAGDRAFWPGRASAAPLPRSCPCPRSTAHWLWSATSPPRRSRPTRRRPRPGCRGHAGSSSRSARRRGWPIRRPACRRDISRPGRSPGARRGPCATTHPGARAGSPRRDRRSPCHIPSCRIGWPRSDQGLRGPGIAADDLVEVGQGLIELAAVRTRHGLDRHRQPRSGDRAGSPRPGRPAPGRAGPWPPGRPRGRRRHRTRGSSRIASSRSAIALS